MLGPCFPVPWLCRCMGKHTTWIHWIALWHFRDSKCEAYLYNLSRLWDAIAFLYHRLCWVRFQWSHRVNSAHANPWLLGLSDGTKARRLSRVPVEGVVGSLWPLQDDFNFKHVSLFSAAIICVAAPQLCCVPSSCGDMALGTEPTVLHFITVATLDKILHCLTRFEFPEFLLLFLCKF